MDIRPDDVNFGAIPMSHSYGFSNLVMPLLAQGTPAELSKSGDAYVGELLRTPRRQADRLGTLLPRDGAA